MVNGCNVHVRYSCLCIITCFECLFCWLTVMVASVHVDGCVYMATPTGRGGGSILAPCAVVAPRVASQP